MFTSLPSRSCSALFALAVVLTVGAAGAGLSGPVGASAAGGGGVAKAVGGSAPPVTEAGRWRWPVGGPSAVVRPFEAPSTRYTAGHRGIDIRAAVGAPVVAPADGVVFFSGRVVDRVVLTLRHSDGTLSSYEAIDTALVEGDSVAAGEPLGTVGVGPHCDGCLHLGVRVDGEYVSPRLFLGGIPRAVLLPMDEPFAARASASAPGRGRGRGGRRLRRMRPEGQARGCAWR